MLLYLRLLRPHQWVKNLLLFVPLFFSGHISLDSFLLVTWGMLCFCIASSLGYIVNDWIDKKRDISHPEKKMRPFAQGTVSFKEGSIIWGGLFFLLLFIILFFNFPASFIFYILLYIILSISYSFYFRNIVLLDIFIVSFGYVLRVLAGGAIAGVQVSKWLFMSIFFLSMVVSIAKRKSEILLLKENALYHRKNLVKYNPEDLSKMLWVMASISIAVYVLYCIEKKNDFIYSVIPATYGIIRFCILAEQGRAADPVRVFFKDLNLMIASLLFLGFLTVKMYIL